MHSIPLNIENDELQHQVGAESDQFLITKEMLSKLVETNRREALQQCGGVDAIVSALRSNLDVGILGDQRDLHLRRQAFGSNSTSSPPPPPHTIKYIKNLLLHALRDPTIHLLFCCAVLSLAIAVKTNGAAEGFIDGAMFLLAISFVVCFGGVVRFFKARWTMMIKKSSSNHVVDKELICRVVRNGVVFEILESQLVVGDIVWLQSGDRVPADGISIFINDDDHDQDHTIDQYPCVFTGSKVVKGRCRMVVTSVGDNTERSMLMKSVGIVQNDEDHRRLQVLDAIEKTNSKFDKIWLSLSLIILVVQFVRCFVTKPVQGEDDKDRSFDDPKGVRNTMEDLMKETIQLMKTKERSRSKSSFLTMLCVLIFASRDCSSLAVFITLLYASNRMKLADAIVHHLQATATLGSTTTVCACVTPDLALHHAKMADLFIGFDLVTDHRRISREVLDALRQGISVHTRQDEDGIGSVEEISLLTWAKVVLGLNTDQINIVMDMHYKGGPELILSKCSHYYTVNGKIEILDANKAKAFLQIVHNNVNGCSSQSCIAFAYKRYIEEDDDNDVTTLESDLTLLGFVCLKNPYSRNLIDSIQDCKKSGIEIKLMVEDDMNTARIMAVNSGLLNPDDNYRSGAVIDAVDFGSSSDSDRVIMVDNIHVIANASPADKLLMVQCLKQKRRVVAVATASVRDSPLLKEADVGISMGAVDADIFVPSNNFSRIHGILYLGRRVCRNIEKIIQLQLTMEISAFTINIISLAANKKEALSSFEVLWINLVMQILGAVAVAIATTRESNPVHGWDGSILNRVMCRSIAVQCLFQMGVIVMMGVNGETIFKVKESTLETMVFNCYAFCQVFMLITAIDLEKRNDAICKRTCFSLGILAIIGVLQLTVAEVMKVIGHRKILNVKEWCICIGIATFSLPLNYAANWIPISQLRA